MDRELMLIFIPSMQRLAICFPHNAYNIFYLRGFLGAMLSSSDRYDYPSTIRTHWIVWRHRHKSYQREQNTIALHGLLRELVAESDKRPAYVKIYCGRTTCGTSRTNEMLVRGRNKINADVKHLKKTDVKVTNDSRIKSSYHLLVTTQPALTNSSS
jgi:hypothetical protein